MIHSFDLREEGVPVLLKAVTAAVQWKAMTLEYANQ